MHLSFSFCAILVALSTPAPCEGWIAPSMTPAGRIAARSTRSSSQLFYQQQFDDFYHYHEQNYHPYEHVMDESSPYMDMYPNAKGEFEADSPLRQHREYYWGQQQHQEHEQRPTPPLSIFQEQHLQTAQLPLEDANYGSYQLIDQDLEDMMYNGRYDNGYYPYVGEPKNHVPGYNLYPNKESIMSNEPILGGANPVNYYGFGESPIMPDYHQNVFDSNVMCVGGSGNFECHYPDTGFYEEYHGHHPQYAYHDFL